MPVNKVLNGMSEVFEKLGHNLQGFSPAEQECISKKISKVVGEGKDQDQAIAIAISECAPGKARKQKMSKAKTAPAPDTRLSNYKAIQSADGKSWSILAVPVFGEIPKGERGNKESIDFEWLILSVHNAKKKAGEGYLPPMHVNHHETGKPTEFAGRFLLKFVQKRVVDGKKIFVLFADLVDIPDRIFRRIDLGELAYRSVEVFKWNNPDIASLALLPDEVPFFKFDLLTIGEKVKATERFSGLVAAVACHEIEHPEHGEGRAYLFNFSGGVMKIKKLQEDENKKDEEKKDENMAGHEDEEKKDMQDPTDTPDERMDRLQALEKKVQSMDEKMSKILAAMSGSLEGKENQAEGADAPAEPDEDEDEEKKNMSGNKHIQKLQEKNADLYGQMSSLKKRLDSRDQKEQRKSFLDSALEKLKGYVISDEDVKEINQAAEDFGEKGVNSIVRAIIAHGEKEGDDDLDSIMKDIDNQEETPSEIQKLCSHPKTGEQALKAFRDYNAQKEGGYPHTMSAVEYVKQDIA